MSTEYRGRLEGDCSLRSLVTFLHPVHPADPGERCVHRSPPAQRLLHRGRPGGASASRSHRHCGEDRETVDRSALVIEDTYGVFLRCPVDPWECLSFVVWQRDLDEEDVPRAVTEWRSEPLPSVAGRRSSEGRGGGVIVTLEGRPTRPSRRP